MYIDHLNKHIVMKNCIPVFLGKNDEIFDSEPIDNVRYGYYSTMCLPKNTVKITLLALTFILDNISNRFVCVEIPSLYLKIHTTSDGDHVRNEIFNSVATPLPFSYTNTALSDTHEYYLFSKHGLAQQYAHATVITEDDKWVLGVINKIYLEIRYSDNIVYSLPHEISQSTKLDIDVFETDAIFQMTSTINCGVSVRFTLLDQVNSRILLTQLCPLYLITDIYHNEFIGGNRIRALPYPIGMFCS